MYQVLKSFHLIFIVTWFAGLFYIFRLFVYHRSHFDKKDMADVFCTMERRLLYYICLPSSALVTLFGIGMLLQNKYLGLQLWLQLKIVFVCLLFCYQGFALHTYKMFRKRNFFISEKACRLINEVPSLLLVSVVFLAILKIQ